MTASAMRPPYILDQLPTNRVMSTTDERVVRAPLERVFAIASEVEHWPAYLSHYRFVRFRHRTSDGGGLVEMAANRPFGVFNWPTWWLSQMRDRANGRCARMRLRTNRRPRSRRRS